MTLLIRSFYWHTVAIQYSCTFKVQFKILTRKCPWNSDICRNADEKVFFPPRETQSSFKISVADKNAWRYFCQSMVISRPILI
jgi:hypothetical protein